MLSGRAAVAARGRLTHLPALQEVQAAVAGGGAGASANQGRKINLFRN